MKKICLALVGIVSVLLILSNANQSSFENPNGNTVQTRILPPQGFERKTFPENSFASYLRNLPLKPTDYKVHLYDNTIKPKQDGAFAVVDMEIGNTDLQQCADAVIRLRAEYLWSQKRYSEIHFKFTSGDEIPYVRWAEGERVRVQGSRVTWEKKASKDYSYINFRKYLNMIFMYAGTASLARELVSVPISKIQPGDVFIRGGHPGHAMIVLDVATNPKTKENAFVCAQSFMPAQEIEVVNNLNESKISPWYVAKQSDSQIVFPEYTFTPYELKRFN